MNSIFAMKSMHVIIVIMEIKYYVNSEYLDAHAMPNSSKLVGWRLAWI